MFPKVPQSSPGILRVPQLPTPLEIFPLKNPTNPIGIWHTSHAAFRSQVNLDDYDLDALELGGLLTWEEPEDITQVINYVAWIDKIAHVSCFIFL